MKNNYLCYMILAFLMYFVGTLNVDAAGQCYDCSITNSKGWYVWSEEESNPNPSVCGKSNLPMEKCYGDYDHTPSCFYCIDGNNSYYKWSDKGINPNSSICSKNSRSIDQCKNDELTPIGDGADSSGNDKGDNFSGGGAGGFCTKTSKIIKFFGTMFKYFRILIPIIIIVLASLDLSKAVTAQKEDDIKKATDKLFKRIIFGVLIFFVPLLISLIFIFMGSFMEGDMEAEYKLCASCILAEDDC